MEVWLRVLSPCASSDCLVSEQTFRREPPPAYLADDLPAVGAALIWIRALADEAHGARPSAPRRVSFYAAHLEVRMFSVGEGEATLIVFPGGKAWLVDGGTTNSAGPNAQLAGLLVAYLERRGLTLEACVASHPHIDHAGALETILRSGSGALAPEVTVYRGEVAWAGTTGWRGRYHAAIADPATPAREQVILSGKHREVQVMPWVSAHLFCGQGADAYTSLFMQLRFAASRLLFTGHAEMAYERQLLAAFGAEDFRADLLKVTHHGSSGGTAADVLAAIRPAFAIASTADDPDHGSRTTPLGGCCRRAASVGCSRRSKTATSPCALTASSTRMERSGGSSSTPRVSSPPRSMRAAETRAEPYRTDSPLSHCANSGTRPRCPRRARWLR
jgi:beta-lactamase superfamily II metal-dependent hydrolase